MANSNQFYFDYQDGKYGFNTNPNRGADTFVPFNKAEIIWTNPTPSNQIFDTISISGVDFTKYTQIVILAWGHHQWDKTNITQIFEVSGTGGVLYATMAGGDYNRAVSFNKNNNTISITPVNTKAGNYQSYTIPVRIWGMKLNADINFSSWT